VSQLGRPDDGTDAVSWFNTDMFVNLQPREKWRKGITKQELVRQMAADLKQIPGVTYNFSQNIQDNVNEAMSGVKGENSIKIFGDDLETLESVGEQIKDVMRGVPGVTDAGVFAMLGQPNLLISVDRQRAARYGLLANDVNRVVQAAVGGQAVTQVLDGERRFDLVVRLLPEYRSTAEAIRNIPISTRTGRIPLREVADVVSQPGASFIYREGNARYLPIKFSVRGRDLKSTIADAESRIHKSVQLPPGFRLKWAGEFQQLQDALDRLMIVVPITLCVIFALLYGYFQSLLNSLIVLGSVPLALLGGVFALLVSRTDLSISATVGFICVLGVVILNGVVLVARVNTLRAEGRPLYEAVVDASHLRLRAVMMVSAAAGIGLLPAAIATGIGSETQQPLARVVVGSMVTAPIATLLVLPALYLVVNRWMDARVGRRVAETIPGGALAGE
jgi:cobalt-zinc-cadmium resistance protein CzcA